jgi:hypothetical protein
MPNFDFIDAAATLIETSVKAVLEHVPAGSENAAVDAVLDKLEDMVNGTATPLDDAIVEPIIARVRVSFNVPDGSN